METSMYMEESDFEPHGEMSDDSFAFDEESDFEMEEPVAVKAKKSKSSSKENGKKPAKKAAAKSKKAPVEKEVRQVLGEKSLNVDDEKKVTKSKNKKTVEEIYQKKTQLEHILLRPDTYSK